MTQTGTVWGRRRRVPGGSGAERRADTSQLFPSLSDQLRHELRTPLNAVIGFSDLMRCELLGPVGNERYREYLDHISDSAQQMLQATEHALAVAMQLTPPPADTEQQVLNLRLIVEDALQSAINDDPGLSAVQIAMEIPGDIEIWGERARLTHALSHLIRAVGQGAQSNGETIITAHLSAHAVALTIEAEPALQDGDHQPIQRDIEERSPTVQSEPDFIFLLAKALFHAQAIPVELIEVDSGCWRTEITLEASAQRALVF